MGIEKRNFLVMNKVEQLLSFFVCYDEFDFHRKRSCKLEELRLSELVMPSKSGHCAERRAAANPELIGLFEQPLPRRAAPMPLTFMHIQS